MPGRQALEISSVLGQRKLGRCKSTIGIVRPAVKPGMGRTRLTDAEWCWMSPESAIIHTAALTGTLSIGSGHISRLAQSRALASLSCSAFLSGGSCRNKIPVAQQLTLSALL